MSNYLDQLKKTLRKKKNIKEAEILLEQAVRNVSTKIFDFFKDNPSPSDDQVHDFSKSLGIEPDHFESIIYKILGSFLGAGKSKDFKGNYDPEQLKMGIKVEMEHTTDPEISARIARDHLAEIPDYYTRLLKMEKEAGIED